MPDYTAHWHQSQPEEVIAWEFQFQQVGSNEWQWVQRIDPVDNCENCFQAILQVPRTAFLIRSRSVGINEQSDWSKEMQISLPEPQVGISLLLGFLFLILIKKIKRKK